MCKIFTDLTGYLKCAYTQKLSIAIYLIFHQYNTTHIRSTDLTKHNLATHTRHEVGVDEVSKATECVLQDALLEALRLTDDEEPLLHGTVAGGVRLLLRQRHVAVAHTHVARHPHGIGRHSPRHTTRDAGLLEHCCRL